MSTGRHMEDQDQTASTQPESRGQPEWAMDGAPAGLCAPARIGEIMLVGMSKHKCGAGVAYTQSSGCRASMLGGIGKDPSG